MQLLASNTPDYYKLEQKCLKLEVR